MVQMTLDLEELLELIDLHGRNLVADSACDDCGQPDKTRMLKKLERIVELINLIPDDHLTMEFEPDERTVQ